MKRYFQNKTDVVRFVVDTLDHSKSVSPLTMTIHREKSADYSVLIVTGESSDDIDLQMAKFYSTTQVNT